MTQTIQRPEAHECTDYYKKYIRLVEEDDAIKWLSDARRDTIDFLKNLPPEKWDYRYGPDKWTIKEVMLHLIDVERIFTYRALRIARNDKTPMPGMEQDDFVAYSNAAARSPKSLIEEYESVRAATITFFKYLEDEAMSRMGTASDCPFSPRAALFIIAGHEIHHFRILKERYL